MTAKELVNWLERLRIGANGRLDPTVKKATELVTRLENAKRADLAFATTDELFSELSRRFAASLFVGSVYPKPNTAQGAQHLRMKRGRPMECVGLARLAQEQLLQLPDLYEKDFGDPTGDECFV